MYHARYNDQNDTSNRAVVIVESGEICPLEPLCGGVTRHGIPYWSSRAHNAHLETQLTRYNAIVRGLVT